MAVILVADDEEMVRIFASTVLRKAGHDVLAARNGFEAVKLYRSSRRPIDLARYGRSSSRSVDPRSPAWSANHLHERQ